MSENVIVTLMSIVTIFGSTIILIVLGTGEQKTNRQRAKVLFTLGTIWLTIAGGSCASMMLS